MSVIAGIHNYDSDPVSHEDCGRLMHALQMYQTDELSGWRGDSVFLGCGVKRVTPESLGEKLPYEDKELGLVITADAVIDNREELFERLQVERQRRNMPDSELILLAYRKWLIDAPQYLIGDYAFVVWDRKRRLLFGARDPIGNRTLYYHQNGSRFSFATTIEPLLTLNDRHVSINETWLAEFLALPAEYESADPFSTAYNGIGQLPPAYSFTLMNGFWSTLQYEKLRPAQIPQFKTNESYEEAFREVFAQAVRSRLRTHKAVGAALSGGLHSGSVAGLSAKELQKEHKPLHTFSYVPPGDAAHRTVSDPVNDERSLIKQMVRHIGGTSDHNLYFPENSPLSDMDEWLDILEMPYKFVDNSFWTKDIHKQAAEWDIGILLTGFGGKQSVSWGSPVDYYAYLLKRFRWMRLYRELGPYSRSTKLGRTRLLSMIGRSAFSRRTGNAAYAGEPILIHPDFARSMHVRELLRHFDADIGGGTAFTLEGRARLLESMTFSSMQGTRRTKLSLRYGVMERDPFLDVRLIRFCLALPLEQFVQHGMNGALLRRAMKGDLPDTVRLNPRVCGIHGEAWVYGLLKDLKRIAEDIDALCKNDAANEYLNIPQIKASFHKVDRHPRPGLALVPDLQLLMRGLAVHRFLHKLRSLPPVPAPLRSGSYS
ncbi:asparagine synthetase B family protein [Paenibacillus humicola]|uniref:asparagine synthetase B family protein n=1 Tax=Paenibacillus humicola TaxID=3110540 RepID=UPI00237B6EF3|nr:asparagine synthase-related protein [Paenibacillus humicola]